MALLKWFRCQSHLFFFSKLNHIQLLGSTFRSKRFWTIYYDMNTVYFQSKGDDKFRAEFKFFNETLNMKEVVVFERKISECLQVFLTRLEKKLGNSMLKVASKRMKKTPNLDFKLPAFNPVIFLDNEPLPNDVVFQDIFDNKINGSLKLRILDIDYNIVVNAPIISQMELPKVIRLGCAAYPEKFESACLDEDMTEYTWFKSRETKNKVWVECGKGYYYIPTEEDFHCFLKLVCVPKNKMHTGPVCEAVSETRVKEFDGLDQIGKRHEYTKNKTNGDEFRVVSYNILADVYAHTKEAKDNLFTYCDPDILDFNYRKDLLIAELKGYNADLICLQEVDTKVFTNTLDPVFKNSGYLGSFCEKRGIKEGCALFYNSEKFSILHDKSHIFSEEILNNPLLEDFKDKISGNEKLVNRLNNLHSVIQVIVLKCLTQQNHLIIIGNTHLYFHPDADHIRLLQGLTSFKILHHTMREMHQLHPEKKISLLLCGDFNSTPDCGFHQFLNEGSINSDHIDWKSKDDEVIENVSCTHTLNIKSACGTPQYTNYTVLFKACLDYIYFQTDHLEVKQTVPVPTEEDLSQWTAIPSKFFPSDHIALVADFTFKSS